MQPSSRKHLYAALVLVTLVSGVSACASARSSDREPAAIDVSRINPLIESLKLHTVALDRQYSLLRASAADYAFRGLDEQLNYIQKAALFVQSALEGAKHQWEILSIVDYIKEETLRDYFTLRLQGLKTASTELAHHITLVDLYAARLKADLPRQDAAQALKILKTIQEDYAQLMTALAPLANPRGARTASLEAKATPQLKTGERRRREAPPPFSR